MLGDHVTDLFRLTLLFFSIIPRALQTYIKKVFILNKKDFGGSREKPMPIQNNLKAPLLVVSDTAVGLEFELFDIFQ